MQTSIHWYRFYYPRFLWAKFHYTPKLSSHRGQVHTLNNSTLLNNHHHHYHHYHHHHNNKQ